MDIRNIKIYNYLWGILFFLLIQSCKTVPLSDYSEYENKLGHKNFYVVDTLQIINPVEVTALGGNTFVMPKDILLTYDNSREFFFNNEYVFLEEESITMDLPYPVYMKYALDGQDDCYKYLEEKRHLIKGYIENVREYTIPPRFYLIVLINREYFSKSYRGVDDNRSLGLKYTVFPYYRVAIPYCFKEDTQ